MRMTGIALLMLVAGCSGTAQNETAADQGGDAVPTNVIDVPPSETVPPLPDNAVSNEAAAIAPGTLPPADAEDRYVGRWAATQQLCATGAWRFQPKRLDTAGEVSCAFDDVKKVPGGYDIAASCLAEGQQSKDTIQLRFAESARAMLVQSKMWDGVGLTYCGAN
ncbi:MAG TPA: hypothetical protein VM657_06340 [Sphingomonas sp.]|nr:hypothetical protein [Sphingomonas sp.]